jgi:hypothetical protein
MSQLEEAISRYQKILESEPYQDLAWAEKLVEQMQAAHLTESGRLVCPFLRPHFLTRRQYETLIKAAECLFSAIDRIKQMVLADRSLMDRLELLPAEKMLASLDPGYPYLTVSSLLDTHMTNGSLSFIQYDADTPAGMIYGDVLADLFYEIPPMKEFRKRYTLTKLASRKHLLDAILAAYRHFGGQRQPRIGILEFRQPFQATSQGEYILLAEYLRQQGYEAEIVNPDQLEYRAGVLRRGTFEIDVIYRRVKAHEFLLRYDLSHPLVRAYRDGKVCVVNSFRSELAHKRALFDLLTDEKLTADFPAAERKAIRQYIPWTRLVGPRKTTYHDQEVDLLEFIRNNREKLILKPNDDAGDEHPVPGWEVDRATWEKAIRRALRTPYVVQERVEVARTSFPVLFYGQMEVREMQVEVHPHAFLGKVQGCSCWVSAGSGFSMVEGLTPVFILEPKE